MRNIHACGVTVVSQPSHLNATKSFGAFWSSPYSWRNFWHSRKEMYCVISIMISFKNLTLSKHRQDYFNFKLRATSLSTHDASNNWHPIDLSNLDFESCGFENQMSDLILSCAVRKHFRALKCINVVELNHDRLIDLNWLVIHKIFLQNKMDHVREKIPILIMRSACDSGVWGYSLEKLCLKTHYCVHAFMTNKFQHNWKMCVIRMEEKERMVLPRVLHQTDDESCCMHLHPCDPLVHKLRISWWKS